MIEPLFKLMDCNLLCLECHVQIACFHMRHIQPLSIVLYIYIVYLSL